MRKETDTNIQNEGRVFSDLARKLLAVPKKEVDKEKAKYERQREKEKRSK